MSPTVAEDRTFAGLPVTTVGEGTGYLKALIYGIPGAGKTVFAGSTYEVEEMKPVLYLDIEGGTLSIEERWPKLERVRVRSEYDQRGRVKRTAWQQCWEVYEALKRGEGGYATVVVDNLSEAYQLCMRDTMVQRHEDNDNIDEDVPDLRAYGKSGSQLRRWVRHLRDLDANVIFTAHEMAKTTDEGIVLANTPSFPGKLPIELAGFMDMVLYLYTKTKKVGDEQVLERKMMTATTGKYMAKDRSGKLPLVLSDPDMSKVYSLYKGE